MTIADIQLPRVLVDCSTDLHCMVCELGWGHSLVIYRNCLSEVPELDSLGQFPCQGEETEQLPLCICAS